MQTYSTKATAVRGAKRRNITDFEIRDNSEGRFVIVLKDTKPRLLRRSRFTGAVNAAHALFDANPDLKRKDAVALAVENGIAFYTARTQYQAWYTNRKEA